MEGRNDMGSCRPSSSNRNIQRRSRSLVGLVFFSQSLIDVAEGSIRVAGRDDSAHRLMDRVVSSGRARGCDGPKGRLVPSCGSLAVSR